MASDQAGGEKAPDAFRTISEVAEELRLPQHVLRFWETRFSQIKPLKRGGGRRYYRREDVELLRGIQHLLYGEGYTIRGVQRILKDQGLKFVQNVWKPDAPQPVPAAGDLGPAEESGHVEPGDASPTQEASESAAMAAPHDEEGDSGDAVDAPPSAASPASALAGEGAHARPPVERAQDQNGAAPHSLRLDDLRKLQIAVDELTECKRLLSAALRESA